MDVPVDIFHRVVNNLMLEFLQIEVRVERSIDAKKEIQVEGGGQPERIVICGQHSIEILDKIGAEQEDVTGLQKFSDGAKK